MIINLSDLMKRINTDMTKVSFEENIESIDLCGKIIKIIEPIKVTGEIITDGKIASFYGQAKFKVSTECDRCLEDIQQDISIDMEEKFTNDSYSDDEDEYYQMIDNKIDFTPVLRQNLLIHMPMKYLCKEDCDGFISKSGIENDEDNESNANNNSPFAKLQEMLKKQGGI